MQIESNLYKRQVLTEKTTNFERTLPKYQSDLALQTFKDPYIFDFLNISNEAQEREIENAIINLKQNYKSFKKSNEELL